MTHVRLAQTQAERGSGTTLERTPARRSVRLFGFLYTSFRAIRLDVVLPILDKRLPTVERG